MKPFGIRKNAIIRKTVVSEKKRKPNRATSAASDIFNLIRINQVDTLADDFHNRLERYATPRIKQRLLSDIQRAL